MRSRTSCSPVHTSHPLGIAGGVHAHPRRQLAGKSLRKGRDGPGAWVGWIRWCRFLGSEPIFRSDRNVCLTLVDVSTAGAHYAAGHLRGSVEHASFRLQLFQALNSILLTKNYAYDFPGNEDFLGLCRRRLFFRAKPRTKRSKRLGPFC